MDAESNGERMEIVELPELNFFIATQYHPEFQSRPNRPSPLFLGFLKAATESDPSLIVQEQVTLTGIDSPIRKSNSNEPLTPAKPPSKKRDQKAQKKQQEKN